MTSNQDWAWRLNHIGTLAVFIIGILGNSLCLIVLCRERLRKNSYTQYLIALAIFDSGSLLFEALISFEKLKKQSDPNIQSIFQHTDTSCKFFCYIRYIFYSMSSWVIVALAVERLVAVRFALWSKYICNVLNARRILLCILLFTMIFQSYHFFVKGLENSQKNQTLCRVLTSHLNQEIAITIYAWRLTLMTILPIAIIITANVLIVNKLLSEHTLTDHVNSSNNQRRKSILLYRVSRMLIILSSVYLVLHVPGSILEVSKHLVKPEWIRCNLKLQYYIFSAENICDLMTNLNFGINFYLYIISGKHIRDELMYLFRHGSFQSTSSRRSEKFQRSSNGESSHKHESQKAPPERRGTSDSV